MSNNELLLQISELLDIKLKATENRLREEIQQVEGKLKTEIQQVRTEIQQVDSKLEAEIQEINLKLENNVIPRLQNIESCYTSTYDRYRTSAQNNAALEADMKVVKAVLNEHSEKLKSIS